MDKIIGPILLFVVLFLVFSAFGYMLDEAFENAQQQGSVGIILRATHLILPGPLDHILNILKNFLWAGIPSGLIAIKGK